MGTATGKQLGDGPISEELVETMNDVAALLDRVFNGDKTGEDRETGFILMVFPLDKDEGRCNYISNADRDDVVAMLKHQIARFEGQPDISGTA